MVGISGSVGCSRTGAGEQNDTGRVTLALDTAGHGVSQVIYAIHEGLPTPPDSPIPDFVGVIDVSDPNSTASVERSFPRSTGDTVTMDADTIATPTAPSVHCHGVSAPFDLAAGGTAMVGVTLTCPGDGPPVATPNGNGSVVVTGTFMESGDNCPVLASWVASPLQTTAPGGAIAVAGSATDPDGDALTVSWSATHGSFANASAFMTQYTCGSVPVGTAESETLTFAVSDGKGCTASVAIAVTCVGAFDFGAMYQCSGTLPLVDGGPTSQECVVGQSYCSILTVIPPPGAPLGSTVAQCVALGFACATNPTCDCVGLGSGIGCSCSSDKGRLTVHCMQF
jgi:hypothetical protein